MNEIANTTRRNENEKAICIDPSDSDGRLGDVCTSNRSVQRQVYVPCQVHDQGQEALEEGHYRSGGGVHFEPGFPRAQELIN
jgi:hypothetical protein